QAEWYARWLAERFSKHPNIVWLNGGDIRGSDSTGTWNIIGNTLKKYDPGHLITFHPFGRMQSSDWFHNASWLDFNMFQSGHRRYDQDDSERNYGENNWRYAEADYNREPVKPTLDGEPSYEGIPQGLHDTLQPLWNENDVRRYAYWSVFAGGCGFTYGHNAVMQFYKPGDKGSYGNKKRWIDAINDPGAGQMQYLKTLMLSRPYFDRIPDQTLLAGPSGEKYDYQAATRGKDYAFVYTYNGKEIKVHLGKINRKRIKAAWYNPRNGTETGIGIFPNVGIQRFDPPGEPTEGNDWILILDSVK
ncbi:MAG TPA: glycoside hydrolase family 140 protein, partial [Prolixibacteraceae bacterium]|nr:glycoside hydrolase family 140 protein [Prolixibacteraceae bacterium]